MTIMCPSMMCAKFDNLKNEVKRLEDCNVDIFHCDVMDGQFVNNFGMSIYDVKAISDNTDKMVDVHLMVENPSRYLQLFKNAGADILYIHYESDKYIAKTLQSIRELGMKSGLAISPSVSLEMVKPLLTLCDFVLVMTVHPGFAGQTYLDFITERIVELVAMKHRYEYRIIVDGACSPEKIKELSRLGCDGFVLGTSALFNKEDNYKEKIEGLRKLCT